MSLTAALNIAQSALLNTSRQTSVVSRNITDAGNPDYARRSAVIISTTSGARITEIQRATSDVLSRQNLSALSGWQGQNALLEGLQALTTSVNGVDNQSSPAKAIGDLQVALQVYSSTPSNRAAGENAVESACQIARTLNDGSQAIENFRTQADRDITASVKELNGLLAEFDKANKAVIGATRTGADPSDALDRRDGLLKKISALVPVSTITRPGNDLLVMTQGGATLYETSPRAVTFEGKAPLLAGQEGNPVYVDGVPLIAGSGGDTSASGKIAATLQLRDDVAPAMQLQLDEIARGLISTFAETDPSGGALPNRAGLFTWPGGPALPGTTVTGLAGKIRINPAIDSTAGGSPLVLRDGGANGAAYVANTAGNASFSTLLLSYSQKLDQPLAFNPAARLGSSATLGAFSSDAISFVESLRQQAFEAEEGKNALMLRTGESLANQIGVNMDEEMALLLDLENSYSASARLIKAADDMLATLLAAVS